MGERMSSMECIHFETIQIVPPAPCSTVAHADRRFGTKYSAVCRSLFLAFTAAPPASNWLQTCAWPLYAAHISGVTPPLSLAFTAAPPASSTPTIPWWPLIDPLNDRS